MANHVSSLKRARQTETRTEVNRSNRSRVRTSLRSLREALVKGDVKAAQVQYRATVSALDKSVQKGILHDNTASRYKSRLNAPAQGSGYRQEGLSSESIKISVNNKQPGALPAVSVFWPGDSSDPGAKVIARGLRDKGGWRHDRSL